eukprot:scaffold408_cov347-Pavlova_lutheri.AAC.46
MHAHTTTGSTSPYMHWMWRNSSLRGTSEWEALSREHSIFSEHAGAFLLVPFLPPCACRRGVACGEARCPLPSSRFNISPAWKRSRTFESPTVPVHPIHEASSVHPSLDARPCPLPRGSHSNGNRPRVGDSTGSDCFEGFVTRVAPTAPSQGCMTPGEEATESQPRVGALVWTHTQGWCSAQVVGKGTRQEKTNKSCS